MEKLISDTNKLMLTKSNLKHKVNKVVRHLLDMEHTLKSCLDNILNKKLFERSLQKQLIIMMRPCLGKSYVIQDHSLIIITNGLLLSSEVLNSMILLFLHKNIHIDVEDANGNKNKVKKLPKKNFRQLTSLAVKSSCFF